MEVWRKGQPLLPPVGILLNDLRYSVCLNATGIPLRAPKPYSKRVNSGLPRMCCGDICVLENEASRERHRKNLRVPGEP